MIAGGGLVGLLLLAFWIWAIFDVIATDGDRCRNLPKLLWLVLVILLSTIGAAAWLMLGRPRKVPVRLSSPTPALPDVDPDTERQRREHYDALDAELDRRLEEKKRNPPPETPPPA